MIGSIPNPKKTFIIPFAISKTFDAIQIITKLNKKYKLTKSNVAFNSATIEASEFLSLGVYIDFNLTEISEIKTEVNIEVRRKLGSFNESHEVTYANEHIDTLTDELSNALTKSDQEIESIKKSIVNEVIKNKDNSNKSWYNTSWVWVWLILFFPVGVIGLIKRYIK
jgi:hypothetical protein|tara:strand:+ start:76 stop:576 length:501 start_codon:yes stop_codon:yes gene_type:complete